MPQLMKTYPGLLPWHFGGDDTLTWKEVKAIHEDFLEEIENAKKRQREAEKASRNNKRR